MESARDKREQAAMDDQFGGAYPRYSGAIDAVIGGPPEDMNQMPPLTTIFEWRINGEERLLLLEVIRNQLSALGEEINHTDSHSFAEGLRERQKKLQSLLRHLV